MLRLTGEFCDVTIFCGTEVRFAHRCVIASGAFFLPRVEIQNILASDRLKNTVFSPIEVTKLTLDWSKWDLDVVDSLLLYIYTSRLNRSNLPGLHAASDFFAIEDLKKLIDSEINKPSNKHTKVADCLKVWITAFGDIRNAVSSRSWAIVGFPIDHTTQSLRAPCKSTKG